MTAPDDLFSEVLTYPSANAERRFDALVGLDEIKRRVLTEARILLRPAQLDAWSERHHGTSIPATDRLKGRLPLFLFSGDVGTGKTELAETFGAPLARELDLPVQLFGLSLSARGTGAVGEMTRLLQAAFTEVADAAAVGKAREARSAVILLIDEADALAQSRELAQMHHEDRAGVNALVRGIDRLRRDSLPVIVIMCTNRLEALDPAIRRRAAATFSFERPDASARMVVLGSLLVGADLTDEQLQALADATGPSGTALGCTFSDLTQRLVPDLVLDAFARDRPIEFARALDLAQAMTPTPTFVMQEGGS